MARARASVKADLSRMEALKPDITIRFQQYQQAQNRRDAQRASLESETPYEHSLVLSAAEHKNLALQLANREQRRRNKDLRDDKTVMDDLSLGIQHLGQRINHPRQETREASSSSQPSAAYHYPSVPSFSTPLTPTLPPKIHLTTSTTTTTQPPTPPPKLKTVQTTSLSQPPPPPPLPSKQDLSPTQSYQFEPAAHTENGTPLRTLFLPTSLRTSFTTLASKNTASNLETCGILCGTLISNALFISHLVIPDQTATSDTCETTDIGETELFDYVDSQDLMVCGWIHTHPTQTCFLSSRDLHTSVGYQVMLPESVAIVCAPSKTPEYVFFLLSFSPFCFF
jgi:STAM-binding protein